MSGPEVVVRIRRSTETVDEVCLADLRAWMFDAAVPWREFRWYRGQRHFSGSYWSATVQAPVGYESRLEYANLLLADFDPQVGWILSQPFFLEGEDAGRTRRRIPDYLLIRPDKSVCVVDVKPAEKLRVPKVRDALAWTRNVIEAHGWEYQVQSEPDRTLLANVQFLAGYRRRFQFVDAEVEAAVALLRAACTFGEAVRALVPVAGHVGLARALVLHLLWARRLEADLARPLSTASVLEPGRKPTTTEDKREEVWG